LPEVQDSLLRDIYGYVRLPTESDELGNINITQRRPRLIFKMSPMVSAATTTLVVIRVWTIIQGTTHIHHQFPCPTERYTFEYSKFILAAQLQLTAQNGYLVEIHH
jgi:hypothetical protein